MKKVILIGALLTLTGCNAHNQNYSWSPQQQRMYDLGMHFLNQNNQQRQTTHTTCSKVGNFLNCTTR